MSGLDRSAEDEHEFQTKEAARAKRREEQYLAKEGHYVRAADGDPNGKTVICAQCGKPVRFREPYWRHVSPKVSA